jgi:hypothetical protein
VAAAAQPITLAMSFPGRDALESYLSDDRRRKLISGHGEVFTVTHAVELVTVAPR